MFSEVGAKPLPGRAAPEWPPRLNVGDGRRWWASAAALSAISAARSYAVFMLGPCRWLQSRERESEGARNTGDTGLGGASPGATTADGRGYLAASNARPAPASSTVRPSRMWYRRLNVGMIFSSWVTTMMAVAYWVAI